MKTIIIAAVSLFIAMQSLAQIQILSEKELNDKGLTVEELEDKFQPILTSTQKGRDEFRVFQNKITQLSKPFGASYPENWGFSMFMCINKKGHPNYLVYQKPVGISEKELLGRLESYFSKIEQLTKTFKWVYLKEQPISFASVETFQKKRDR